MFLVNKKLINLLWLKYKKPLFLEIMADLPTIFNVFGIGILCINNLLAINGKSNSFPLWAQSKCWFVENCLFNNVLKSCKICFSSSP